LKLEIFVKRGQTPPLFSSQIFGNGDAKWSHNHAV
jgi:hypothetical protein